MIDTTYRPGMSWETILLKALLLECILRRNEIEWDERMRRIQTQDFREVA